MSPQHYRSYAWIHTWSSLICTVFLLLLCLTGLPLIFHHEIDSALGYSVEAPIVDAPSNQTASLDLIAASAHAQRPNEVIQYIIWELDTPHVAQVVMAKHAHTPPDQSHNVYIDNRTAHVLPTPKGDSPFTFILRKLHTDLFMGLGGKLFLGAMGGLFVVATVSGLMVYGTHYKKRDFGDIRHHKNHRSRWLDRHNVIGISTIVWVLTVGGTGTILALADVAVQQWRQQQLTQMTAPYAQLPPLNTLGSAERARTAAMQHSPNMNPSFVAYPGTTFSSQHHYTFFMRGDTPLSSYVWHPVLIDAQTSMYTDSRQLPWYLTVVLSSKPFHNGDYAGLPLKIIWAILDGLTLIILGSGVYLWFIKRRRTH